MTQPSADLRDASLTKAIMAEVRRITTQPWNIMEICGGQTHALIQYGLDQLLPPEITLIHGPGCPVCVTSLEAIEQGLQIASRPDVIFTTFGDMLRVPGNKADLFGARSQGADVRVVYSPLDSLKIANENPEKQVVFFAIGFETTAPTIASTILSARKSGIKNFSILPANVSVPPAMHAILSNPANRVQGFLAAGHVCAVMGYHEYLPIAERYRIPIVVTGFEPVDLATGILMTVKQLEAGEHDVTNAYPRFVTREGNLVAQRMISEVFEPVGRQWRGIGTIPLSGLGLRPEYASFNAISRFDLTETSQKESSLCIAGKVLSGVAKPLSCPAFGQECTPAHPLGAPMVSSEGACSAYYRYHRTIE